MIHFAYPYLLLSLLPLLAIYYLKGKQQTIQYAHLGLLKKAGMKKTYKHLIGDVFITLALTLLVIALARPQVAAEILPMNKDGIDMVMVLDVSNSMDSIDIKPDRLTIAKRTIDDFIDTRYNDRIGLVIFSGSAFTRIPPTLDHNVVQTSLDEVSTESVSEDGTAIGMAISVGINRLKKSDAKSKIIVLVTDGDNNAGAISPETAADLAKDLGIKIYTIGVGTDKTIIPYEYFGQTHYETLDTGINEPLLTSISESTGGTYYRAQSEDDLEAVFANIDQLETTDFKRDAFKLYDEWAFPFIMAGLVALLLGIYFKKYRYIQVP